MAVYDSKMDTIETMADESGREETLEWTTELEKKLVWKIDLRLITTLLFSYMLQFIKKTALGYTAILGIIADTHLVGQDYSWASSAFYYGYLASTPIASLCLVNFPLGKCLAASMGIVVACHEAANSMANLTALRVLLSVFESTITPGLTLLTGMWYKRSEHAMRHGIWFAGNSLEKRRYTSGFIAIIVSPSASVIIILTLRVYMSWENYRRNKAQGKNIDPEAKTDTGTDTDHIHDMAFIVLDKTDGEDQEFRYFL